MARRGWWHIVAKLLQCLQFPAWEQPLSPAWGRLRFPACLGNICQCPAWARLQSLPGTLATSLPGNACQFPAWERLPVCMSCLGMLAVPAWDACQYPAWERLPVPCLGTFCSPCLGRFASSLPGNVCQCPAWERLPVPCLGTPFAGTPSLAQLFSYAYRTSMRRELLRLFKPEMPRTPVPCYFVSAMNVKGRECKAKEKRTNSNQ